MADIGGGIAVNEDATLTVINSTMSDNHVDLIIGLYAYGGGIAVNAGGQATLINSTVSGNSAYYGGGIYNGGFLTLINTTLANNSAEYGGGLYNTIPLCGCGGVASLINSTVSGNYAVEDGGGIYHADGMLNLTNTIVAGNSSGYGYTGRRSSAASRTMPASTCSRRPAWARRRSTSTKPTSPTSLPTSIRSFGGGLLANNGGPVQTIAILARRRRAQCRRQRASFPHDTEDLDGDNDVLETCRSMRAGSPA